MIRVATGREQRAQWEEKGRHALGRLDLFTRFQFVNRPEDSCFSLRKSNILRRAFILPRLPGEPGTQLGLRAESSTGRATASSILRGCTWAVGGTFVRSGRVSRAHDTEVCLGVSRIRGRRHGSRAFPLLEPVATHASHNGNGQGPLFRGRCATSPRPRRWTCRDQIQKWTRTGRADCQLMTKTLPSWDAQ